MKISDQVLANYIFYHVFIEKELLDFSTLLNEFFDDYPGKMRENLYPALDHLGYKHVLTKISPSLDKKLASLAEHESGLLAFYDVFPFYKKEEILLFINRVPFHRSSG